MPIDGPLGRVGRGPGRFVPLVLGRSNRPGCGVDAMVNVLAGLVALDKARVVLRPVTEEPGA